MILLLPLVIMPILEVMSFVYMWCVDLDSWRGLGSLLIFRSVFEVLLLIYWTKVRKHDRFCLSQGFNYLRPDSSCTCETAFWSLMTNAFSYTAHSTINGRVLVRGVELILINMMQNFVKSFLLQKLCAQTGFLDYKICSKHIITIYHDELNFFLSVS